jgi:type II secretory pathway pseudopilin PulG
MNVLSKKPVELRLGGEPRVDLLPPEVHEREKVRSTRRLLGLLVILAIVAVGAGYGFAIIRSAAASAELQAAQDRTQTLLAEQLEYAEASATAGMVDIALEARTLVLSNEVLWTKLIDEIKRRLPSGATVISATMAAKLPWEPEMEMQGPLRAPRVATVTFVIESPSLLDPPALIRGLSNLEGFADATPDVVTRKDTVFETTITLNLNTDVLNQRFADAGDDNDE